MGENHRERLARQELQLAGAGVFDRPGHLDLATARRQCARSGMDRLDYGVRKGRRQGNWGHHEQGQDKANSQRGNQCQGTWSLHFCTREPLCATAHLHPNRAAFTEALLGTEVTRRRLPSSWHWRGLASNVAADRLHADQTGERWPGGNMGRPGAGPNGRAVALAVARGLHDVSELHGLQLGQDPLSVDGRVDFVEDHVDM